MESRYGVGINNRYAAFFDLDDQEDDVILQKAAAENAAAAAANKKARDTQKVNGVNQQTKKDTKSNQTISTSAAASNSNNTSSASTTVNTNAVNSSSKKNDGPKPTKGEDKENRNRFDGKRVLDARKPQEGPREQRSREERNNRRNRKDDEPGHAFTGMAGSNDGPKCPDGQLQRDGESRRGGRGAGMASRGGRGGGGGPRGGGGGGGERRQFQGDRPSGNRGGKREFDRKSGDDRTGVKSVDKREGSGSHNWGTFEDEMKAEEDKANASTDEAHNDQPKEDGVAKDQGGDDDAQKESDEPKYMTLDEWKKQQGERTGPKFNLRKAGEGSEIDPKWKKTYAYKKEKETHEEEEEEEHELYPQRVNRQKRLMDIEINFADNSRGGPAGNVGPGRGGRGSRGNRGAAGDRGGDRLPRNDRRGGGGGGGGGGNNNNSNSGGHVYNNNRGGGEVGGEGVGRGGPVAVGGGGAAGNRGGGGKTPRGRSFAEAPNVNDELSFPSLGKQDK